MFGVSYAALGKLKRKIKVDHELAEKLWATGNHDARIAADQAEGGYSCAKQRLYNQHSLSRRAGVDGFLRRRSTHRTGA